MELKKWIDRNSHPVQVIRDEQLVRHIETLINPMQKEEVNVEFGEVIRRGMEDFYNEEKFNEPMTSIQLLFLNPNDNHLDFLNQIITLPIVVYYENRETYRPN